MSSKYSIVSMIICSLCLDYLQIYCCLDFCQLVVLEVLVLVVED